MIGTTPKNMENSWWEEIRHTCDNSIPNWKETETDDLLMAVGQTIPSKNRKDNIDISAY